MIETDVFDDGEELMRFAADRFAGALKRAAERDETFTAALSGGSTPAALYRELAKRANAGEIDLSNARFYFGDERCVPAEDVKSNFRMARETLFDPAGIPAENIFRWRTELEPERAAAEYGSVLRKNFGGEIPRFDVFLLGLGADGHTASLFPNTDAVRETEYWAVANRVEKLGESRLTMTLPVINNAANVLFLITGASKADAAKRVFEGEFEPYELPAQLVSPANGRLYRLLDAAAASKLGTAEI